MAEVAEMSQIDQELASYPTEVQRAYKIAEETAKAYKAMQDNGMPHAANALVELSYPPEMDVNKGERLIALQAVIDIASGSNLNAGRVLNKEFEEKIANWEEINQNLTVQQAHLTASPDDQFIGLVIGQQTTADYLKSSKSPESISTYQFAKAVANPKPYRTQVNTLLHTYADAITGGMELAKSGRVSPESEKSLRATANDRAAKIIASKNN